jgi:gas vesicle protein
MNNNKFLDGVLWGLLIGGAVVFLLGTKKGNKVLKTITEEGTQSLNKIVEDIESVVEDIEDEVESEAPRSRKEESNNTFSDNHFEDISAIRDKPASQRGEPRSKRFFRSSKK